MRILDELGRRLDGVRMSRMPDGTCAITLEAPHVHELARKVASWLWANPSKTLLAFSHAPHVRYEPRAGLIGPREVTVQQGILLVAEAE